MPDLQFINDHLQVLFNEERYTEALEYLKNLKSESNQSPELLSKVYYHIGRILFYNGDLRNAKENFLEVLKINPSNLYSLVFVARIIELEGKPSSAMKLFSQALKTNRSYTQLLHAINGSLQDLQNDDEDAEYILTQNSLELQLDNKDANPKISILVLCYNKLEYTEKCLKAIFDNTTYNNFEVIVVDNASVDDTPGYLETYGKLIKYVHAKKNLGFVGGNNLGAQFAEGEFLVFLNNDTEVQHNWLTHLYNTFVYYPNAGAAGSMLIYPDGKLQEAGGIIFQDMSGWNYGRKGDPLDSKFNFVREVDYCSGAALMVRRELFNKLNGFDERYSPAYCEDTDLCFGIRKLGYKVYYNPLSKVVHHEGATAGTDLNSGFKKYQVINAKKFKEKWADEQ
ncbi:MAG: glycosyltransferase [Bacteroidetes bacterium]|nr:glycosyltransferase [Bacteroidota bacterium]